MKQITCDRCGQKASHGLSGAELIIRPADNTWTEIRDLCRKCAVQLQQWLNQPLTEAKSA